MHLHGCAAFPTAATASAVAAAVAAVTAGLAAAAAVPAVAPVVSAATTVASAAVAAIAATTLPQCGVSTHRGRALRKYRHDGRPLPQRRPGLHARKAWLAVLPR